MIDENRQSYLVINCYFKLYTALFPLKWLICIPNISAVRRNVVFETLHNLYRTAIIENSIVKFEWTATDVPNETAHKSVVDQVYINGATYNDASQRPFFKEKDLYLNGDLTLDFKTQLSTPFEKTAGKLVVEKNSTLKSTYPLTLVLSDDSHEIKAGVTFKTVNVTLDAATQATIKGGKGYTFDGQKTSNVTITQ